MPRNGSGVYTLPAGNPVVPGTTIDAAWANSTLEDMANEITNSLSRTGAGGMIAPFRIADGNITAPGLAFLNETGSGLYRSGTASVWMAIQGVNTAQFTTTGVNIPVGKSLGVAGSLSITGSMTATGSVTTSDLNTDHVDFNTAGGTDAVARLIWNDTDGTLNLGLKGGNVVLQVGQEEVLRALNATGSTMTSGQVVYITGASGQRPTVALAQGNAEATSTKVIGIVTETIANNAQGFVTTAGLVRGVNTSAFAEGAVLWLSASTPGAITSTRPTAPNHAVLVGYCVRSHATEGIIYVMVQNGYELDELHDVLITNVANNNMLRYNSAASVWENIAGPAGAVVGTTDSQTLTNKTISGSANTLSNIGNASLVNSSLTIGSTSISLGATATTLAGLTSVTATTFNGALNGNATNVTGTVAIANGGTGATTASSARTNLGLAIGTDVPSPTGTGASGTWGISITGNAATVTNGVVTTGSYSDPSWITALAGSKITGNISGNAANVTGTVAVANGGTGATTAANARVNLLPSYTSNELKALRVNAAGTDVEWFTVSAGGDVAGPASATDNALVRFDATTGKLIQNSVGILSDTGDLSGIAALSMSGALTLSGGTANGVAYLNGSKVLTTGSALTFNGSNTFTVIPATGVAYNRTESTQYSTWMQTGAGNANVFWEFSAGTPVRWVDTSAGELMRLTSTGLGIGTSSPVVKLDVNGAMATSASGGSSLLFRTSGTTNYSWANQYPAAGNFSLYDHGAGATVLTVNSGNLGLGETPSAWGSYKAIDISSGAFASTAAGATFTQVVNGTHFNGTNWIYRYTGVGAARYEQSDSSGGVHRWFTAPSGTAGNAISFTQAMTLDASGNLGIGSTSPSAKLELAGVNNPQIALNGSGATGYRGISYQYSGTQYGFAGLNVQTGEFLIRSGESGQSGYYLTFQTNGSERARITSGGNLLVGTTASQGKLTVQTDITAINSGAWYTAGSNGGVLNLGNEIGNPARVRAVTPASRGAASELALAFDVVSSGGSTFEAARINSNGEFYIAGTTDQGAYNLQVNGTGVWGAGAYVNGSDVRLKENVQTLTDGLSVVTKLRPVTFQYKAEYSKDTAVQPGFIAQELQQAMAGKDYVDGVVQSGPEYLNVAYQSLIPVLVKAIQELKAELDSVKTELATLKGN